jgi:hypothetical protein
MTPIQEKYVQTWRAPPKDPVPPFYRFDSCSPHGNSLLFRFYSLFPPACGHPCPMQSPRRSGCNPGWDNAREPLHEPAWVTPVQIFLRLVSFRNIVNRNVINITVQYNVIARPRQLTKHQNGNPPRFRSPRIATTLRPLLQFSFCRVPFVPTGFYPFTGDWHLIGFVLFKGAVLVRYGSGPFLVRREIRRGEI